MHNQSKEMYSNYIACQLDIRVMYKIPSHLPCVESIEFWYFVINEFKRFNFLLVLIFKFSLYMQIWLGMARWKLVHNQEVQKGADEIARTD